MPFRQFYSRTIQVGNKKIGPGQPIFLTAEIGAAHQGSAENVKIMIKAAAAAGCDGADLFMATPEGFYWCEESAKGRNYRNAWRTLSFTDEEWLEFFELADSLGIILYPTLLDLESVERCRHLPIKMANINSDDANDPFLIRAAASLGVPLTMHDIEITLSELSQTINVFEECGFKDLIVLHSTHESGEESTLYRTANLKVMDTYRQVFGSYGYLTGCVEHTTSDFLIYAVAALEPALISKHIQISKDNPHDTQISVKIDDLAAMVKKVRYVEMSLGVGVNEKVVDNTGIPTVPFRRKVLVARHDIPAGKVAEESDFCAKRPGDEGGVAPMQYIHLVGAKAKTDIKMNTPIEFDLFEGVHGAPYKYPDIKKFQIGRDLKDLVQV